MTHPAIDLARRSMRHLLAALLAATIAAPAAAFTADETAWIETINDFAADVADMGIPTSIALIKDADDKTSPVSMAWMGGRCVFIVSVAGNSYSQEVQRYARSAATARLAAVAHEYWHCLQVRGIERGDADMPPVRSPQAEAMADAFAVLWIYCTHPDRYRDALAFFRKLRSHSPSGLYSMSSSAIDQAAEKAERGGHSCSKQTVGAV